MTLIRRGDRWAVKVWQPAKQRYLWVGTYATQEEALAAERESVLVPKRLMPTIGEWGQIWLSDYARDAPATRLVYRQAVARITKDLGARRLDAVSRVEARQWANRWPRNISAVARTMWEDAKDGEVVRLNPWANMKLRQSRGRKDIIALTEPQLAELAALADQAMRAVILTLGYVGLRPGELCGLEWDDLDLAGREMFVRRSLDATGELKLPKNGQTRTVTVPPPAAEAIRALPRSLTDGYVFHTVTGRRLSKGSLFYMWRPVRLQWEALGNPGLDMYSLRHAAATILLERGLSAADVAVQLGHVDGGILVMERYGHPDRGLALDRIKMAFSGGSEQPGVRSTEAGAA